VYCNFQPESSSKLSVCWFGYGCVLLLYLQAVDEFFSKIESQKLDMKLLQQACISFICLVESVAL